MRMPTLYLYQAHIDIKAHLTICDRQSASRQLLLQEAPKARQPDARRCLVWQLKLMILHAVFTLECMACGTAMCDKARRGLVSGSLAEKMYG